MVKGSESLVVCSYTWLRDCPTPAEISRVSGVSKLLAAKGVALYSEILDPNFSDYSDQMALVKNSAQTMSENGLWLAVVANNRRRRLLAAQAALAVGRNMQVVLACQDEFAEAVPELEQLAEQTGRVFYWEDDQDLRDGIQDVVLPMCDNISNDCNTFWPSKRKTA